MKTKIPNIVLIMSDEHDAAVTGCYGDSLIRTPNLDNLASQGTTFESHYCNSPLCVPSRSSFTVGRYTNRCDVWSNGRRLPDDAYPTFPRLLQQAGVTPYLCGKQHYCADLRYGFTDLIPNLRSNQSRKSGLDPRRDPDDQSINHKNWNDRSSDFYEADTSGIMEHDRTVNKHAIDFLNKTKKDDNPFLLFVGHLAPHFPLTAPKEIVDYYRGKVPSPKIPKGMLENQPLNYQHLRRGFGVVDIPEELVQYGRELYWALTDWYDRLLGDLFAAIKNSVDADNTIIIYTSDHGENKGDHGMWWKNNLYDHAARVPLIIHDPRPRKETISKRCKQVTSHVDLVQTLLELQDATQDADMDGDSLTGLLADPTSDWKDQAVSQYFGHNIMSGMSMIRQGRYKYIYHSTVGELGGEQELYDMIDDPDELSNLASDPIHAQRLRMMYQALIDETGEDPNHVEARSRVDVATGYAM